MELFDYVHFCYFILHVAGPTFFCLCLYFVKIEVQLKKCTPIEAKPNNFLSLVLTAIMNNIPRLACIFLEKQKMHKLSKLCQSVSLDSLELNDFRSYYYMITEDLSSRLS